ncbi:hypothetical protein Fot_06082 [Forsythia ovata]|uniref:Uncharacterized protein n=1 Tax=Forsythia ovata TaxID=205694 RepID=A0ABD1WS05_9LAMI
MGNPHILPAPEATTDVPSTSIPARPVPPLGNVRQSVKRKAGAKSGEKVSRCPRLPLLVSANTSTLDPTWTSWIQQSWENYLQRLPLQQHQFINIGLLPLGRRQTPRK